jgi:hypothetical protein
LRISKEPPLPSGAADLLYVYVLVPSGTIPILVISFKPRAFTNPLERYNKTTVILLTGDNFQDKHNQNTKTSQHSSMMSVSKTPPPKQGTLRRHSVNNYAIYQNVTEMPVLAPFCQMY